VSFLIEGIPVFLDAPTALAFLLGILSFRWWYLGPAALAFISLGRDFPLGALILGVGLSLFDHMRRNEGPWWMNRPGVRKTYVLLLLSLLGTLLFWRQGGVSAFIFAMLPWVWYRPIETWMSENSGGGAMWMPVLLVSCLMVLLPQEDVSASFLEATVGAFFLLVAWYRKIPLMLKFLALVLGCSFWLSLSLHRIDLFLVMLGMALFQSLEGRPWGRGSCRQVPWSLYTGIVWLGLLVTLPTPTSFGWLPMVVLLIATQLLSQEVCRLCIASARCREGVFSIMASRMPLLFGIIWAMEGVHPVNLVWLYFFVLGAESTKSTQLRPTMGSAVLESPCRSGWEKSLQT
jgi:hypothetical protein